MRVLQRTRLFLFSVVTDSLRALLSEGTKVMWSSSKRILSFSLLACVVGWMSLLAPSPVMAQQTQCVPRNVFLVLDKSGSMTKGNKWNEARAALSLLVSTMGSRARFGLATFAQSPSLDAPIPSNASQLNQKILQTQLGGDTHMVPAIQRAGSYLSSLLVRETVKGRPTTVVLITDGAATDRCPVAEVKALRSLKVGKSTQNVRTYVVAFKSSTNSTCLNQLATAGGTARSGSVSYIFASDTSTFLAAMTEIIALPNVREDCNGKDDDCDGKIDNLRGSSTPLSGPCLKGYCGGRRVCSNGAWSVCQPTQKATVEICDGRDNDCDGYVDNLQGKKADETLLRPCSTGCGNGVETCQQGRWQHCTVSPRKEVCNGKDDDCDGKVDNLYSTNQPLNASCSIGECGGQRTCAQGQWSACKPTRQPTPEVCNGKDDDCDGAIDNLPGSRSNNSLRRSCTNLCGKGTQSCTAGIWGACNARTSRPCKGACGAGTQSCAYNEWGLCSGRAHTEVCDGRDNDCDGSVDENCACRHGATRACGTNRGECSQGRQTCNKGRWGSCIGGKRRTREVCDGRDNDCDGRVDESWSAQLGQACGTLCGKGVFRCHPSKTGVYCAPGANQQNNRPELCNNRDDDCDGVVDEGLQRRCYSGPPGTSGKGICQPGIQVCSRGRWGSCIGELQPVAEVCDGRDNDCDGVVDEGFHVGQSCQGAGDATPARVGTWAGSSAGFQNGALSSALFNEPSAVVQDSAGNTYIADRVNHRIRKIAPGGVVSTFAGSGKAGGADGRGYGAQFDGPAVLAIDKADNLYVVETGSHRVRKITPAGIVSTLAGSGTSGYKDGPGAQALFWNPRGLAVDGQGHVYVSDSGNNRIRKITAGGVVSTVAGSGRVGRSNGVAAQASFSNPSGLALSARGELFIADTGNHMIRKLSGGVVSTVAGSGLAGHLDGFTALFRSPSALALDGLGNLYISDQLNYRLRKVLRSGEVVTVAGSGTAGNSDGYGGKAEFRLAHGIWVTRNGSLLVADLGNHRLRSITLSLLKGPCSKGVIACRAGRAFCRPLVQPAQELCDGKDNDCDGRVDEDWPNKGNSCFTGLGFCQSVGTYRCAAAGNGVQCSAQQTRKPTVEICDAVDNDCDGRTDEGLSRACRTSCGAGTQSCNEGRWGSCESTTKPSPELCDGKDNDCDGRVDENWPTLGKSCTAGSGACQNQGRVVCAADGKGVRCNASPRPATTEVCDGRDNDCDGKTDEGLSRECANKCGQKGRESCRQGRWVGCTAPAPRPEVCDGKDNDCNGKIDDLSKRSCRNACGQGSISCKDGKWTACLPAPRPEVCDGKDNDCDGRVDENLVKSCTTPCGLGSRSCQGGDWGECQAKSKKPEICDGKDNDCDGKIDNKARCPKGSDCLDGKCRKTCRDNDDCPAGEVCKDGICTTTETREEPLVLERTRGDGGAYNKDSSFAPGVGCICQANATELPLSSLLLLLLVTGFLRRRSSRKQP
jgi:sugar lactone lactonase YvrE/uncharacterized protein YegL